MLLITACATYDDQTPLNASGGGGGGDSSSAGEAGTGAGGAVGAGAASAGMSGSAPNHAGRGGAEAGSSGGGAGGAGAGGAGGVSGGAAGKAGASGAAGASGNGGAGGSGGSGGVGPTYRYFKLVALTEQNGAAWSSVAELQILTTGAVALERGAWSVTADSSETDDEYCPASDAIDGNSGTLWHSAWEPPPDNVNDPKPPHFLVVDMASASPITGFSYLPRQTGVNGRIRDWEAYVSKDGQSWGSAVKTGSFPNDALLHSVMF